MTIKQITSVIKWIVWLLSESGFPHIDFACRKSHRKTANGGHVALGNCNNHKCIPIAKFGYVRLEILQQS